MENTQMHETTADDSQRNDARRDLLRGAGMLAGGVLAAGVWRPAFAQEAAPPLAPGDLSNPTPAQSAGAQNAGSQAPGVTGTDSQSSGDMMPPANVPPEKGMIAEAITNPGPNEVNDAEILNYALTLEYLEADFYNRVVAADEARAFLRGRTKDVARILMRDENVHVQAVSDMVTKLGGTPVAKPTFQFPAEAFISQVAFLQLSAQLEETGVSAYSGQGPNVRRKDVLNFAASIYGNEARHTGLIRFLLGDNFAPRDMELPLTMAQVLDRVKPFIVSMGDTSMGAAPMAAPAM